MRNVEMINNFFSKQANEHGRLSQCQIKVKLETFFPMRTFVTIVCFTNCIIRVDLPIRRRHLHANQGLLKHEFFPPKRFAYFILLSFVHETRLFFQNCTLFSLLCVLRIRIQTIIYKLKVNTETHCACDLMSKNKSQNESK